MDSSIQKSDLKSQCHDARSQGCRGGGARVAGGALVVQVCGDDLALPSAARTVGGGQGAAARLAVPRHVAAF